MSVDATLNWSDLDHALFLLDAAEQSIVDEFGGAPSTGARVFLESHRERVEELRREWVSWQRSRR